MIDLHAKNQLNICKRLEKQVQKTVWSLQSAESKARNFAKIWWSEMKLEFDL